MLLDETFNHSPWYSAGLIMPMDSVWTTWGNQILAFCITSLVLQIYCYTVGIMCVFWFLQYISCSDLRSNWPPQNSHGYCYVTAHTNTPTCSNACPADQTMSALTQWVEDLLVKLTWRNTILFESEVERREILGINPRLEVEWRVQTLVSAHSEGLLQGMQGTLSRDKTRSNWSSTLLRLQYIYMRMTRPSNTMEQ